MARMFAIHLSALPFTAATAAAAAAAATAADIVNADTLSFDCYKASRRCVL